MAPLHTGGKPCGTFPERRRPRMIALRFVVACDEGHIDDFPWVLWAHSRPGLPLDLAVPCANPLLRLKSIGKAGLMGLLVKCEGEGCAAKGRSLLGSAGPRSLEGLKCSGNRPWLGPHGAELCQSAGIPRMLQKGATNLYFAKLASSILIPPYSDPLRKLVDDEHNWRLLFGNGSGNGMPDESRLRIFAQMKKINYEALKNTVSQKMSGLGPGGVRQSEEEYRFSEYQALLAPVGSTEQDFITESPSMDKYQKIILEYFDRIILVKKLAETLVLTGFSRITPPPYREYDEKDRRQLSLIAKPWLPGVRVFGEGVFLTLRKAQVDCWLQGDVTGRYDEILKAHNEIYRRIGRQPREIPSKFFLLHTLAHLLVRRLSYECGYGSSALRERIYCWEGGGMEMNGFLIYTAAGDSEGTMGGLVEQGRPGRFEQLLMATLEDGIWCSSDPLCIESRGQGIDSLNRAACHACALLPETSCEEGNRFLDRVAVTGTPEAPSLGYFGDIVSSILTGSDGK